MGNGFSVRLLSDRLSGVSRSKPEVPKGPAAKTTEKNPVPGGVNARLSFSRSTFETVPRTAHLRAELLSGGGMNDPRANSQGVLEGQASPSLNPSVSQAKDGVVSCQTPNINYPFGGETFKFIEEIAPQILNHSAANGAPPVAVAGAIADEYNTQSGFSGVVNRAQDNLITSLPQPALELDAFLGLDTKLLNAHKNDLGAGNIKLETAWGLYQKYPERFQNQQMDHTDMVDHILSTDGTAHVASLVIMEAKEKLDPYLSGYSQEEKEAVYVTYYKQGDSYIQRFLDARAKNPGHRIAPGEGCGVLLQRSQMMNALGLS